MRGTVRILKDGPAVERTKPATRKRFRWRRALAAAIVLLSAASIAGMVWYHRFSNHVTVQEVSHEVRHSTFETSLRGGTPVKLQLYQQSNARAQPVIIFSSGDGGWSPFCADVAAHMAAGGKTVVGFNVKDYLTTFASSQKPVTPEELGRDYSELIKAAQGQPGVDPTVPVTLSGWSLGAGFSVLAGADSNVKNLVGSVVAISLPTYNELAWKPTDALIYITHGVPHEKVFDANDYLRKLAPVPLLMLNATSDDTSPLAEAHSLFDQATGSKRFYTVNARGHHFEGGEAELYRDLDESLSNL